MAYRECDCPYHYDECGCMAPGECPNEGTIRVPGYGWLCPQCYDEIDGRLNVFVRLLLPLSGAPAGICSCERHLLLRP
jgi:hypothetical protein